MPRRKRITTANHYIRQERQYSLALGRYGYKTSRTSVYFLLWTKMAGYHIIKIIYIIPERIPVKC